MGIGSSTPVELNIEGDCNDIESIVKKKAADLTEEDKQKLNDFQEKYGPVKNQLSANVQKAREATGIRDDPSFNDFAKATAGVKKLLRITKKSIQEQEERRKNYHAQAVEWKNKKDIEKCKLFLILEKKCKTNMERLVKRVDMLYTRLNDNKEGDMCGTFMNVMEGVADALRSINQDIKTLEPDQLKERLDAMNDYLKELDCAVEDANDEDYSAILAELEEDEGEEVLESLPSVPTTIIEKESSPEKEEAKVETRVAVMEE